MTLRNNTERPLYTTGTTSTMLLFLDISSTSALNAPVSGQLFHYCHRMLLFLDSSSTHAIDRTSINHRPNCNRVEPPRSLTENTFVHTTTAAQHTCNSFVSLVHPSLTRTYYS
ncbi:hypothetical protein L6452_10976 [Arctium lappa]|uniref:Uncharacterized protein n=1 Tax=Arctium lappa TaxID=4217 RepID=A0ACB9DNG9_ARCLA|nr:hypothetical protein L6452_10976 [Arctium lappa]